MEQRRETEQAQQNEKEDEDYDCDENPKHTKRDVLTAIDILKDFARRKNSSECIGFVRKIESIFQDSLIDEVAQSDINILG